MNTKQEYHKIYVFFGILFLKLKKTILIEFYCMQTIFNRGKAVTF